MTREEVEYGHQKCVRDADYCLGLSQPSERFGAWVEMVLCKTLALAIYYAEWLEYYEGRA